MKAIYTESSNDLSPTGGGPTAGPASISVRITTVSNGGTAITVATAPEPWRDGAPHQRLLPGEVPLTAEGQTWRVAWQWQDATSAIHTYYEDYLVVAAGREPVMGEITLTVDHNTYVDLAGAGPYLVGKNVAVWNAATRDERARALLEACAAIDRLPLAGAKHALIPNSQPLQFPRWRYPSRRYDPTWIPGPDEGSVPQAVKMAQVAEAVERLRRRDDARLALQRDGVKSVSLEGVSESYELPAVQAVWSAEAREWLHGWIEESVSTR